LNCFTQESCAPPEEAGNLHSEIGRVNYRITEVNDYVIEHPSRKAQTMNRSGRNIFSNRCIIN
jgi:hypothetical protein